MTTTLTIIRHCEAQGNFKRLFQGHTDEDISKNGEKQLEALRERCHSMSFEAVYSSPLLRAQKTARAATDGKMLPIHLEKGLMEINGGHWEGKPWAKLPELYPAEARLWYEEPWNFKVEGGESMREVRNRIVQTVLNIARREAGRSVCIVSHGCVIRNLLCWASGLPIEELNNTEWCDNTAISVVELGEDLSPMVIQMNDNSHLSNSISTFAKQTWWKKETAVNAYFQ